MHPALELEKHYCARNYNPLPVVLVRGEGAYLWDADGKRYLDMMSAYSAVSHGHRHPRLVTALKAQLDQLAVCSRAFFTDKLGPLMRNLSEYTGFETALPMNTGAEAVETALKAARKWAYKKKKVPAGKAQIIACRGNFHGRTLAIVSMSTEEQYRDGFGPFLDGFTLVPYGDVAALEAAITPHTAAFLVEPIQGEAGIIVPPIGYLSAVAEVCRRHNVLLICDEVQTGLGRTGKAFGYQHDNLRPDAIIVGKALGGGLLPISAFIADWKVMDVFTPGDHGSTFGGNPLAAAVATEAINVLREERLAEQSAELGHHLITRLKSLRSPLIKDVRGRGLFVGFELHPEKIKARRFCEALMKRGVLSKETHETVVRLAPPLIITKEQIEWAVEQMEAVLRELESNLPGK